MPLRFERPSIEYMRELKAVARSAKALSEHFPKINRLPDDFPEEQVKGFCDALVRLPEGTAEGSIAPLRAADSELNRIRQRFIPAHSEDDQDDEPFLARDGDLDLRLVSLMAAVRSAIERYKVEAGEELDTDVTPDLAVTPDIEKPRLEALAATKEAGGKIADAEKTLNAINNQPIGAQLQTDKMLVKDAGTQVKATDAALATNSPRANVLDWLANGVDATAKALEHHLAKNADKLKRIGKECGDGAIELLEINFPKIVKSLKVVNTRLGNVVAILRGVAGDGVTPSFPIYSFDYIEVYNCLLRGEAVPPSWAPHITLLDFDLSELHHLGEDALKLVTGNPRNFSDITHLTALTSLTDLRLNNTQVADIAPLAALTSLTSLSLTNTQVADIAPLAALTGLTELWLTNTQVADIAPLATLTSLTGLSLTNTQVTDIAPLATLTSLKTLLLDRTQVADIAPLATLTNLTELWLDYTQVADIAPLANLTSLTVLSLDQTQVADIAPLAALTSLTSLWLDNTPVADIAPLAALTNLETIWLNDTGVRDFSPLKNIKGLTIHRGSLPNKKPRS